MQFGRVRPATEAEYASDMVPSEDYMCECDGQQEEIDVCCSIEDSPVQPTARAYIVGQLASEMLEFRQLLITRAQPAY